MKDKHFKPISSCRVPGGDSFLEALAKLDAKYAFSQEEAARVTEMIAAHFKQVHEQENVELEEDPHSGLPPAANVPNAVTEAAMREAREMTAIRTRNTQERYDAPGKKTKPQGRSDPEEQNS